MTRIRKLFAATCALSLLALLAPSQAFAITKCQDAKGRWHYGSSAAAECKRGKTFELSSQTGVQRKKKSTARTREEIARQRQQELAEKKAKLDAERLTAETRALKLRYAHEDDIIYERNRKLKDMRAAIEAGQATLASLRAVLDRIEKHAKEESRGGKKKLSSRTEQSLTRARNQVRSHARALREKNGEHDKMVEHYQALLERYRDMTSREAAARPAS